MNVMKSDSPCKTCTRVKCPQNCDNKGCFHWRSWFLNRWSYIHGFYLKHRTQEEQL